MTTSTKRCSRYAIACLLSLTGLVGLSTAAEQPRPVTLADLLQQVLDYYPSLESAALQVKQAQQTSALIESRLGWQLNAQVGISQDMSLFGSPVTSLNAGTHLTRALPDGDSLAVSANILHDDADETLPTLPNPSTSTSVELLYRKPLAQGKENIDYQSSLKDAASQVDNLRAVQQLDYEQIAEQLIDLYTAALASQQRIDTIRQTIRRSQRLHQFILDRVDFGIAEDKDRLQTDAQLHSLQAQLKAFELIRTKQTINLNRLLGKPWQTPLTLATQQAAPVRENFETLLNQARDHSPLLKINAARLALADTLIERQRDTNRDRLDLVLSIGHRGLSGDSAGGSINNNEMVGGAQLEFGRAVDRSSNATALYQAQLARDIVLQDKKQVDSDLHYTIATLLAELAAIDETIRAWRRSVASEHAKLEEAEKRYRTGRIAIDQVLQFENQTATSELELALQQIEYQRTHDRLELIRGTLWEKVLIPPHLANQGEKQ